MFTKLSCGGEEAAPVVFHHDLEDWVHCTRVLSLRSPSLKIKLYSSALKDTINTYCFVFQILDVTIRVFIELGDSTK